MLKKSKFMNTLLALMLSAAVAVSFTGCGSNNTASSSDPSSSVSESSEASESSTESSVEPESESAGEATEIGEGETAFVFEVVLDNGTTAYYNVHTDETTVGAALLGVGLIAGDDSEYGLYVKTVDGTTVDYDADGKYWAFYIDGEYASTGVDSTDLVPGSTYSFKVEK